MPGYANPIELLGALKGAPLHCLYALSLAGQPLKVGAVEKLTRYSYHPVIAALNKLNKLGLAIYDPPSGTWRLAPQAPPMAHAPVDATLLAPYLARGGVQGQGGLPAGPLDGTGTCPARQPRVLRGDSPGAGPEGRVLRDDAPAAAPESRALRVDSPESTSVRRVLRAEAQLNTAAADRIDPDPAEAAGLQDSAKTVFAGGDLQREPGQEARHLRQVLRNAGIGQPKAGQLAGLAHVSARYVCAHLALARREGIATGLLIFRIQQADPMPPPCRGGLCPACILPAPPAEPPEADEGEADSLPGTPSAPEGQPAGHPSLDLPVAGPGSRSAGQCWETARSLLRPSLGRSAFIQYLAPAHLARYEPAERTFVIAASTPEARAWLENRLASRLKHALEGLVNAPVRLCFIPPPESPPP